MLAAAHPADLTRELPRPGFAPWRLSGTVYGTLLNDRPALAALGAAAHAPPYQAPPRAPVLYLKPRNTLLPTGAMPRLPLGVVEMELGASLALLIGRSSCALDEAQAWEHIAGWALVLDFSVPHASLYRPAASMKARDGSCLIGPELLPRDALPPPETLALEVRVDGVVVQQASTAHMQRPAARLLAEVSAFMTLAAGDLLLLGVPHGAPRVRAGQQAEVHLQGFAPLRLDIGEPDL